MDPRVLATLLVSLSLAVRAEGPCVDAARVAFQPAEQTSAGAAPVVREERSAVAPVHVGALIGLVSLPRPVDAEVFVRIVDLFAIGFGYSDFPAFIASPLLDLAGAQSGATRARLDRFNAFDLDLRVFPFRGRFFLGSSFGHQSLKGVVIEEGSSGLRTGTVDVRTWYATPRVGWLWKFEPGFLLGFDLGIQFKLSADRTVTVQSGTTPGPSMENLADLGASYPLPSLHLRLGWML